MDMMDLRRLLMINRVNLFDPNYMTRVDGSYYDDEGQAGTSSVTGHFDEYISVAPEKPYSISGEKRFAIYYYTSDKMWISKHSATDAPFTFTTPSNCRYIRIQYRISDLDVSTIVIT